MAAIQIGGINKEGVEAAKIAIMSILDARADEATKRAALKMLSKSVNCGSQVSGASLSNMNFYGEMLDRSDPED